MASDLAFYQKNDYASLVLCGNRRRGEILAQQLREKHLSAFLAFPLTKLPAPGQILLTDGALPFGMEYPGWDYHMHGDDEFLPLEQLEENTRMMAAAILRICGA